MVEFDCCECGVHVVAVATEKVPEPPLCAMCLHMPSWFEDPELRKIFGQRGDVVPEA
jgi:hypothetical protein